jgi:hypothetical protein
LGSFGYTSSKLAGVVVPNGFRNLAYIFVMHVTEELSKWPEREKRTRHWVRSYFLPRSCCLMLPFALCGWPDRKSLPVVASTFAKATQLAILFSPWRVINFYNEATCVAT